MYKTRKEFIVAKYEELRTYFTTHFHGSPFPSLDDVDITDVLLLITTYFSPLYESQNYEPTIKSLLSIYGVEVKEEIFIKHYPFIKEKLTEIIEFLKSQH